MTTGRALIATSQSSFSESYLIDAAGMRFDNPLNPLLLCAILASPLMMCALPLTWLLMH